MNVDIDVFKIGASFALLSHPHMDHLVIPAKFTGEIHASHITCLIMNEVDKSHVFVPSLAAGKWTRIHSIDIYSFDSNHMVGSLGFFIPSLCLLHWGDGRPEEPTIRDIKRAMGHNICPGLTIRDDCLHKQFPMSFPNEYPTIQDSIVMLTQLLNRLIDQQKKIWIHLASCSGLEILPKSSKWRYKFKKCGRRLADSICQTVFNLLELDNGLIAAHKIYVSRDRPSKCNMSHQEDMIIIKLSALHWFVENLVKFEPIQESPDEMRVFVCFHASGNERKLLDNHFHT